MPAPAPVTVVIDTREQTPWRFADDELVTVSRCLAAGDYSVDGLETQIALERKSLDDFVQTVIHARERFERELQKLAAYQLAAVVVEGSYRDLAGHNYRSLAHPSSVFGLAAAIYVDHGVPVLFLENAAIAARFAARVLKRYARKAAAREVAA